MGMPFPQEARQSLYLCRPRNEERTILNQARPPHFQIQILSQSLIRCIELVGLILLGTTFFVLDFRWCFSTSVQWKTGCLSDAVQYLLLRLLLLQSSKLPRVLAYLLPRYIAALLEIRGRRDRGRTFRNV